MNFDYHKLKRTICAAAMVVAAFPVLGQDKLASMAPVDRKLRAIDSVAIMHLRHTEEMHEFPAAALYPEWHNNFTNNYGVALPSEYKIDLRQFCMPTDSRRVTSHFGYRPRFRRRHYGTDIKVYVGDTIRAAFSGKVRIVAYERKGYGKYIMMRHSNGLETLYGHLSKQLVKENQVVRAGDPIGLGGNTGRSTGSHLHFETRFLGRFIDPEKLFDFEAADVLGDYYVYHSNGRGVMLAANNMSGGESEVTDDAEAAALAKAEESKAFQQEKIAAQKAKPRSLVHKVKSGESLYIIAKKYGTTVAKLCKLNNISTRTTLRPGQILKYS